MNEETRQFVEDTEFDALYAQLSSTHRPIKATFDHDRLGALGLLIVRFQRLEYSMRSFVGFLSRLGDQQLVDILTVKYSFTNLVSVLRALAAKDQSFTYGADLDLLLRQCSKAEQVRNQLIHSIWTSGQRLKIDLKHGLQYKFEKYAVDDLKRIAAKVDQLDTAIEALMFRWLEGNVTPADFWEKAPS